MLASLAGVAGSGCGGANPGSIPGGEPAAPAPAPTTPPGPTDPDATVDLDPGRIRSDVLFKAAYGATAAGVQAKLVTVDFVGQNYWEWEKAPSGTFVWKNQIPQAIVDAFEAEGFARGGRW